MAFPQAKNDIKTSWLATRSLNRRPKLAVMKLIGLFECY